MPDFVVDLRGEEPHPVLFDARDFLRNTFEADPSFVAQMTSAFESCSPDNNAIASVLHETLRRMEAGEPVSQCEVWGLAWFVHVHGDIVGMIVESQLLPDS